MNKRAIAGLVKHGDFIVLDLLCLQLCYTVSYWFNVEFANPYAVGRYRYQALVLLAGQLLVILFSNNYHGIIRRSVFDEVFAVVKYTVGTFVLALVYLFMVHWIGEASRLQIGLTAVLFPVVDLVLRQVNKHRLRRRLQERQHKRSLVLVTSTELAQQTMNELRENGAFTEYFVWSVVLMDGGCTYGDVLDGVPVMPMDRAAITDITHGWVDEVFILQPDNVPFPAEFVGDLMEMGVTVSYAIAGTINAGISVTDVGKVGPYAVLTSSIQDASTGQLFVKRLFDILGGLVGCVLTGLIFLVVGPMIYLKSPGPIFFSQQRVGRNGKPFTMYKFRSMYLDAEERKAALEAQNRVGDGLMFKLDDDPRIIGSEKRGKDGKPRGVGHFIRRYSIDEFPQFLNVLRGEMSLVGTRPPTMDEWERYDLEHRVRMSIKPGITGLWQVSGRSKITDFNQVVRLDREYIENWNLGLDVKILLKTVVVVVGGRGAL
ncbi:MAG: sugar transferase [Coriobacteriales bacterium]|nr:sugar transferase [Coriobacteriales bacterium]